MLQYHRGDAAYRFLNATKIGDFDELNELFFEVLAKQATNRPDYVRSKFQEVPYLNSSLFEITDLEDKTILISNLKDRFQLPLFGKTVLKDQFGKARSGEARPLHYFFEFLDAYDFASEGSEDIQEDNKTLINASVLGLIFEKINGYKDGSFFTPGFITMYMCRETIRRAVLQKFNEHYKWNCADLHELYNKIEDRTQANTLINSLRLCDPAVGSGHFLVSALNELIAIKSELQILCDRDGKRLRDYHVEVVNDELVVTDEDGNFFEYNPRNRESQRIQEALFREKQTIIENCLFGVDINPNSVKICRLRLWIELLKNAYYTDTPLPSGEAGRGLETLPNIDINIKQGNSLISRFALDADLSKALKSIKYDIHAYRGFVRDYHHATDKEEKRGLLLLIDQIKGDFRSEIHKNDPLLKRRSKLAGELYNLTQQTALFGLDAKAEKERQKKIAQVESDLNKVETQIATIQNNRLYENAFEWRFEFPEVLDEQGNFVGFDVVMGNPPYIRQEELGEQKTYLTKYEVYAGTADIYAYFYELGINVLKQTGLLSFITSNKFIKANYGKNLRNYLTKQNLLEIIDFGELPVFQEAATFPVVILLQKDYQVHYTNFTQISTLKFDSLIEETQKYRFQLPKSAFSNENWMLSNEGENAIIEKMKSVGIPLKKHLKEIQIKYGIKTGFNKAFIIDEATRAILIKKDPKSIDLIKPFVVGDDVRNYEIRDKGKFIILTKIGVKIDEYPAIFEHLSQYQDELEKRWDKGNHWWELRACDYYDEFLKPKIIYPVIAKESRFTIDKIGYFSNDKTFIIPQEDFELLGFLNSKLVWYYLKSVCSVLGDPNKGGRLELRAIYVYTIPVPKDFTNSKIESLVTRILAAKQADPAADTRALEAEIDGLVYALYGLTEEEIGIVEGV